jgi:hypothetical protein
MVPLIVCRFAHVAPLRRPYSFENELVAIGALKDPDLPLVVLVGASKDYRPLAVVAERGRGGRQGGARRALDQLHSESIPMFGSQSAKLPTQTKTGPRQNQIKPT